MTKTALECETRGTAGVCATCGRMVPDTCGKDDPREEQKAPEPSQEATETIEAPAATQVAETPAEATSEAPTRSAKTRKAVS